MLCSIIRNPRILSCRFWSYQDFQTQFVESGFFSRNRTQQVDNNASSRWGHIILSSFISAASTDRNVHAADAAETPIMLQGLL